MTAIESDVSGWDWLRRGLQVVSSPGMAVASGLALVVALSGAMFLALNSPGDETPTVAEGTIAAVAVAPLPTEEPTQTPVPEPTATQPPQRTVAPAAAPTQTPVPRPTATSVPTAVPEPVVEPTIAPVIEEPPLAPAAEDPALAMAPAPLENDTSADLAQAAAPEVAATGEEAPQAAPADDSQGDGGRRRDRGRKESIDEGTETGGGEAAPQPVATEAAPVPDQAVAAMENAEASGNVSLPPAPLMPMPPSQAFLPITPTPADQSTPSPDSTTQQAEAPQVAEQPASDVVVEGDKSRKREKRKKSDNGGTVHEWQQSAVLEQSLGWSGQSLADLQSELEPQVTEEPAAETAETTETVTADGSTTETVAETTDTSEQPRQIDPATGLEIDPETGLLIDPNTGYLIDMANGRIIDPRTGYVVHPYTGLLIDPATGALLDPVTLAIVVPAGFGSDTPTYIPGDGAMRGQIESVVDATYDDATYKIIPGTDGPVQPVDEIVVQPEAGESIEIGNEG
jgi:hypothetical protein